MLCTFCVQEGGFEGPENRLKRRRINNRLISNRPKTRVAINFHYSTVQPSVPGNSLSAPMPHVPLLRLEFSRAPSTRTPSPPKRRNATFRCPNSSHGLRPQPTAGKLPTQFPPLLACPRECRSSERATARRCHPPRWRSPLPRSATPASQPTLARRAARRRISVSASFHRPRPADPQTPQLPRENPLSRIHRASRIPRVQ